MLKPTSFRELNPWTPCTRGVESPTVIFWENGTNWEFITKLHVNLTRDITLINGFSDSFWIAKTHISDRGMESPVDSAWYENLSWNYIKSRLIKLHINIITNMLRGKSRNMRTFSKIENLRFLQNYDDYNCIFGIKSKGLSLSFIWRVVQWN